MALFVQKYGGSSVADAECMRRVAGRIRDARRAGNQVVVVVSAMGDTTDELIALAKQVNPEPNEREIDSLMATGEMASSAIRPWRCMRWDFADWGEERKPCR